MVMDETPEREAIDDQYKWDLGTVYQSTDAWKQDYEQTEDLLEKIDQYEGQLLDDPETLHEALQLKDTISRNIATLRFYAGAKNREDTRNSTYNELKTKADDLGSRSAAKKSFIVPELEQADPDQLSSMLDTYDPLQDYEHYIEDIIRMRDHTLSKEKEELVAELSTGLDNEQDIHQALMNADMPMPTVTTPEGEEITVTHANRSQLLKHQDRSFREQVYTAYIDTVGQYDTTLASNLHNKIDTHITKAEIRGFDSSLESELKQHAIPTAVYETLLETVKDHSDLKERKRRLREAALGLEDLEPWDGSVPIVDSEEPTIEYDQAKQHILEALEPLGDDYVRAVQEGLEQQGWVDVYPNKGKRSGAFSWGTYDTQPFLMMNYDDDIDSMYTLAHELGHSMHSLLANEEQSYVNASYPIFTAEVASTVNEALLTDHLLDTIDDDAFRSHVLDQHLSNIEGTLFTQARFADFEKRAHEHVEDGGVLTADTLDTLYEETRIDHGGQEADDPRSNRFWMVPHHFYRPFYVYQYATGISAALSLADGITDTDDPGATQRYKDFLKSGGSDYPLELLTDAGVDLTSAEPVEDAIENYETHLEEMEATIVAQHS